jgi:hypothetical protein
MFGAAQELRGLLGGATARIEDSHDFHGPSS